MNKRIMPDICILILLFGNALLAQDAMSLANIQDNMNRLAPDPGFGKGIDWGYYFPSGHDFRIGFLDDGSIFIASLIRNKVLSIDGAGDLKFEFGQVGQGPGDLTNPTDVSILDGKYVVVTESILTRRISIFDLHGNIIKIIKVNDALLSGLAVGGERIAVVTRRMINDDRKREEVYLKDIQSDQTIPIDAFEDDRRHSRMHVIQTEPSIFIARIDFDKLLVGFSKDDKLSIYSKDGKRLNRFSLGLPKRRIKREEIRDFLMKLAGNTREDRRAPLLKAIKENVERMELPEFYPSYLKLAVDDQNRILVYGHDAWIEGSPVVADMYSSAGAFLGKMRIEEGEYKAIYPQNFHKNYLYDLFIRKADDGTVVFSRTKVH